MVQRMTKLLESIGLDKISDLLNQDGNIAETFGQLIECLIGLDSN